MAKGPEIPKTDSGEIEILIERLKQNKLEQRDVELIERLLRTVLVLVNLLQRKNMSIRRLRDLIFGRRTEKRKTGSVSQPEDKREEGAATDPGAEREASEKSQHQRQAAPHGHGRRATAQYRGAKKVECRHEQYQAGARCPDAACPGRLYDTRRPNLFIQFRGQPILEGVIFEREVLRCSACQERYVASLPEGVSETRYEASADVAIVLAKYGAKLPFYRLAQVQESCGVPVSESVMFERSEQVADRALPVYLALKQETANGEVIHTDDTPVKILSCMKEDREEEAERRATNTSGIVIKTTAGHLIALYASGRRHAGENLDQLLEGRADGLGPPIQMADALAANWKGRHPRIAAKCWAHARRKFIEIEESFPVACGVVLEAIGKVYGYEAEDTIGRLMVLVNNASAPHGSSDGLEDWMDSVETDLLGAIYATRWAVAAMRRGGGGAIVNIASISALWHGRKTAGGFPGYDVAKAGMIRMTTRLASLAEKDGIRVNCLAPGWIATDGPRQYWESLTPAERLERNVPSRLLTIDQISEAVVRLAEDQALAGRVLVWWSEDAPYLIEWGDRGYREIVEF